MAYEILEGNEPPHDRGERRGNLSIAGIGPVLPAFHDELMDRRVEGFFHLRRSSGEFNHVAPVRHGTHVKPMALKPGRDGLNVNGCRPEPLPEFVWREPLMEIRG